VIFYATIDKNLILDSEPLQELSCYSIAATGFNSPHRLSIARSQITQTGCNFPLAFHTLPSLREIHQSLSVHNKTSPRAYGYSFLADERAGSMSQSSKEAQAPVSLRNTILRNSEFWKINSFSRQKISGKFRAM
jgi:hypothetical protein